MRRRRKKRGIALPWEQRKRWLHALFAGSRWRTIGLVGITAAAFVFLSRSAEKQRRIRATRIAIRDVRGAAHAFRDREERCPRSSTELSHPPHTHRRYLREMPRDGWGRRLKIRCPSPIQQGDIDVISAGPSGSFHVDDNIQ